MRRHRLLNLKLRTRSEVRGRYPSASPGHRRAWLLHGIAAVPLFELKQYRARTAIVGLAVRADGIGCSRSLPL